MTWAKYGVEFFDQCSDAGLSDAAVRTHAEAIGWLYHLDRDDIANVSILKHQVRRFAGSEHADVAVKELLAAQFWREGGPAYTIVHHADVVRASLAAQRLKRDRDRQAQRRKRARTVHPDVSAASTLSHWRRRQTVKQTSSS